MANPLKDLQDLVNPKKAKVLTATVVFVTGQKVKVQLNTGTFLTVWGTAEVGNTVLVEGTTIKAIVGKRVANQVFVP